MKLLNLGCFSSAEKHMRMVLAMNRLVAATGHFLRVAPDRSGATVDRSHDIQHGDVRIGGPHEPGLLFSPRLLLVHNVVRPGMSSLGAGL